MSTVKTNNILDASGGNTATINSMTPTADSLQGFRNRIINGDMRIDQRNAGASITQTVAVAFPVDRFFIYGTVTSKFTAQQNAGSVTPPNGFTNYLGITSSAATSLASGDYYLIYQRIEGFNCADLGWGTASAKTVTLSFQVYSSLTGTFGGSISNSANNRSYPFTYSIASANTWTSISITIPGDTSGTWLTNNGTGIAVQWSLGTGSTYSGTAGSWSGSLYFAPTGATSVVGTNGATFYITGVQLEVGSVATPFERRDYGRELIMCQRYLPKVGFGAEDQLAVGQCTGSTTWAAQIPHIVQPRTAPTGISAGAASNFNVINSTSSGVAVTSIAFSAGGLSGSRVTGGVASGLTAGDATILRSQNSTGYILFTGCEL
jgi:hypothetical protein